MFYKDLRLGFEFKFGSAVQITRSMRTALETLHLDMLYIVHAGEDHYALSDKIQAMPLKLISSMF